MSEPTLLFEVRANVARITLNRPDRYNTLDLDMARALMHAAIRCDEDPEVRAVILSGAGRAFCGGGDIKSFAERGADLPRYAKELTVYLHAAVSRFLRMEAPMVAAVQGSAAGAGMSLALASDLLVAADSARFVLGYIGIGLSPDGSASYSLPRLIGRRRALDLTLTNRPLPAAEALARGLVSAVVPEAELQSQADKLANQLAAGPTRALGAAKRLLRDSWTETLETQMEQEARSLAELAGSDDAREGIRAFLEKRPPRFQGR